MSPRFSEPDVIATVAGADLAIAVKRLITEGKLDTRIREGIRQIRRSRLPGVVVVDASLPANPKNQAILGDVSLDTMMSAAEITVRQWAADRLNHWKEGIVGTEVAAITFQFHVLQNQIGTDWGLNTLTVHLFPNEGNARRRRAFDRFNGAFNKGIPLCAALIDLDDN